SIMKTDVYTLPDTANVSDAMRLFIDKKISAAPIVNDKDEPIGFISDGDILKRLAPRSGDYTDPIIMVNAAAHDIRTYDERLESVMTASVYDIGSRKCINVNIHDDLKTVCHVLSEYHLKKVPVEEDGKVVGVVNRSDITKYSMQAYLSHHPQDAVFCEDDKVLPEPKDESNATTKK
ncbi:MAG: CBS domain-containing protein, partial [Eggerthellaceae bacterium]|nr:CBS domain-containing protein [Eggerthellaceae bacterium]